MADSRKWIRLHGSWQPESFPLDDGSDDLEPDGILPAQYGRQRFRMSAEDVAERLEWEQRHDPEAMLVGKRPLPPRRPWSD